RHAGSPAPAASAASQRGEVAASPRRGAKAGLGNAPSPVATGEAWWREPARLRSSGADLLGGRLTVAVEDLLAAGPHVDDLALRELQLGRLGPRHLRPHMDIGRQA